MAKISKVFLGLFWASLIMGSLSAQQEGNSLNRLFEQTEKTLEKGQFLQARKNAHLAQDLLRNSQKSKLEDQIRTDLLLGRSYQVLAIRDSAGYYIEKAFLQSNQLKKTLKYEVAIHWANVLAWNRKFNESLTFIEEALVHFKKAKNEEKLLANTYLSLGIWHLRQGGFQDAENAFDQALAILQNFNQNNSIAAQSHNYSGYALWKMQEYNRAIEHFLKAEEIFLQIGGVNNNYLAGMYINMGACYDDMGFASKAVVCYERAYPILSDQNRNHPHLVYVYNNLGNAYGDLGEFTLAIRYLNQAIQRNPQSGRYLNNLGDVYLKMDDFDEAEKAFLKSLELQKTQKNSNPREMARPLHNLGIVYRYQGFFQKSLEYELESLPYRKSAGLYSLDVARSFLGVAQSYMALESYDNALVYLDSALLIQKEVLPSGLHAEIASAYISKAECLKALNNYIAARHLLDSALMASNFQEENMEWSIAPTGLLAALQAKGRLLYSLYQMENKKEDLFEAAQVYQSASKALKYFRNNLLENQSKAAFASQHHAIYFGGIQVLYELLQKAPNQVTYFEEALALSERSKGSILLENMRKTGAIQFAGIPDSILFFGQNLQEKIHSTTYLLNNFLEDQGQIEDSDYQQLKEQLFESQRKYEDYQKELAHNFPAYFNYKYGAPLTDLRTIQDQLLQPEQTLLEYVVGEKNIFIFLIQADHHQLIKVNADTSLNDLLLQFQEGLTNYPAARTQNQKIKAVNQYIKGAQELYQLLIAPVADQLDRSLLIIPDGALGYLPFEALLSESPKNIGHFSSYPYLVKDHQISYCYSTTLYREMREKIHLEIPTKKLLALAPFYPGSEEEVKAASKAELAKLKEAVQFQNDVATRGSLAKLPFSGIEVYTISNLWDGDYYLNEKASKDRFLQSAPHYQLLHLSTHGVMNNQESEYSYLAFTPNLNTRKNELLYVQDLYNLQLNADLVVLSACETGLGELLRGEGIISLARAFAYAGAKSIVNSLWVVRDGATKNLMQAFYVHLRNGYPKDQALHQAKLDFLNNFPGEGAYPYYWAGFVGVGDMGALVK